jgi:type I restriction enzyme S subunit
LNSIEIAKPNTDLIIDFETKALKLFNHEDLIEKENQKLTELKELLLSKLATVEN